MPLLVQRQAVLEGKAGDAHGKPQPGLAELAQVGGGGYALEALHQLRHFHLQLRVPEQPFYVLHGIRHAVQEMGLPLVKAAQAVSAHGLHDADIDEGVVMPHEGLFIQAGGGQVMLPQLRADLGRQVGLGVVEQGGQVIMRRAASSALVVYEPRLPVPEHDIARLEIPVKEAVGRRLQQEIREADEIVLEFLLVERDLGQLQEIVFEIIQVPHYGLAVEAGARVAELQVQAAAGLGLEARQAVQYFLIRRQDLGGDLRALALGAQVFEKRGAAQVFLEVNAPLLVGGIDLRHREFLGAEMAGEFQEGPVLQLVRAESPYHRAGPVLQAEKLARGTVGLQRLEGPRLGPESFFIQRPQRRLGLRLQFRGFFLFVLERHIFSG